MTPREVSALDWRREYVVCEHVAALADGGDIKGPPSEGLRHSGMDVCCQPCYEAGFLGAPLDMTVEPDGLCVGRRK